MIDSEGFRANVGIILCNDQGRLFWAKRAGQRSWQFPQGGIDGSESPEDAMYRELWEETGLDEQSVEVMGRTNNWLRYRLPANFIRRRSKPLCIGQKQIWFLLRFKGEEADINFDATDKPEFDGFRWVDFWHPSRDVVFFKRKVYERALSELGPLLYPDGLPEQLQRRRRGR